MNQRSGVQRSITEQASFWLDAPDNGEDLTGFGDWVRASPEHARRFATMAMMRGLVRELNPQGEWRLKQGIRRSGSMPTKVVTLGEWAGRRETRPDAERGRWIRYVPRALAAVFLLVLVGTLYADYALHWIDYSTMDSGPRTIHLRDGSVIYLGSRSRLEVKVSDDQRRAQLEGEALFRIARRPGSTFEVELSGGRIQVLGTQFEVRRGRQASAISVIEGNVRITGSARAGRSGNTVALEAGQSVRLGFDGRIQRGKDAAAAGVSEPLMIRQWPLPEVAELFNRRNATPQFVVEPGARSIAFSAILGPNDTDRLIEMLKHRPDLEVIEDGNIVRILPRVVPEGSVAEEAATD
jgi:transmembrane sensor